LEKSALDRSHAGSPNWRRDTPEFGAARQLAGRSRRARAAISEMFHGSDQLPLCPHANRVLVHRLVNDLESHKGRQFETLQADADLGGTLSDHADVRRGGEDFVDTPRALFGTATITNGNPTIGGSGFP
jgi:hypothetical protein